MSFSLVRVVEDDLRTVIGVLIVVIAIIVAGTWFANGVTTGHDSRTVCDRVIKGGKILHRNCSMSRLSTPTSPGLTVCAVDGSRRFVT